MKFIVLSILPFLYVSCSDMKKVEQLEQIEMLQSSLDSLETQWNTNEATQIDSLENLSFSKIDSIGNLYNGQEIELVVASKIDLFKQSNHDFKELKKIHEFYPVVLKEKQKSLKLLKKDIEKGSGRREKYDEYIDFEQKELSTICKQYDDYQRTKKRCFKNYMNSQKTVNQLLDSLKIDQQNSTEIAR
jgi:hypothetical protein